MLLVATRACVSLSPQLHVPYRPAWTSLPAGKKLSSSRQYTMRSQNQPTTAAQTAAASLAASRCAPPRQHSASTCAPNA